MSAALMVIAISVAVAAALRSTWSPCGWSMLSTITPLTERARGHRFGATASWFVVGSSVGGALLGLIGVVLAAGLGALGWPGATSTSTSSTGAATTTWAVVAIAALASAAIDLGRIGPPLPHHRRQVSEVWIDEYRPWVYGSGFGVQIGCGLATYIMTGAVYLTMVLAALVGVTNGLVSALLVGVCFGFARGLAVLLGGVITSPGRLLRFHRRFASAGEPVRWAVAGVQLVVATIGGALAMGVAGAIGAAATAVTLTAMARRTRVRVTADQDGRPVIEIPDSARLSTGVASDRRAKDPMTA